MVRKINSMGYRKGFAAYQKITSNYKKAPDFGEMYVSKYGERTLTVVLEHFAIGLDSKECQIFFVMGEYVGSIFCTMDCAGKLTGKAFSGEIQPAPKDRYLSKDRREWITPFYFCNELDIEITGSINTTNPENSYFVNLRQPGPPVHLF